MWGLLADSDALDAEHRLRPSLEAALGDRLPARVAGAVGTVVDSLQGLVDRVQDVLGVVVQRPIDLAIEREGSAAADLLVLVLSARLPLQLLDLVLCIRDLAEHVSALSEKSRPGDRRGPRGHLSGAHTARRSHSGDETTEGAIVVIGESKLEEQLQKAVTRANKTIEKQLDADSKDLKKEIDEAEKAEAS